ncbi:MAG: polysaccharide deacetylase family protein [Lentimicrobiaceae bacterium]|nr:polysaccharide deacetylase family protein [Lentimicrobiaceae bacterium]
MIENKRYSWSPIHKREDFSWPHGKRLALYIGLNLEHFSFGEGLGAKLTPSASEPDVLNYSWRDYGNRVGVWRLYELFQSLELPVSLIVNSSIYDYAPEIIETGVGLGYEIVAHGRTNSERQSDFVENDEKKLIDETTKVISRFHNKPKGWLGPWISESITTPDLLEEAGYSYLLDWCHDDQPTWLKTRNGKILSIPYPQEINDIPAIIARQNSAEEFSNIIIDNFDEMLQQSEQQSLVMGIALHPYIVGQPFRLKHLRTALTHIVNNMKDKVWFTTAGEIAEYYCKNVES